MAKVRKTITLDESTNELIKDMKSEEICYLIKLGIGINKDITNEHSLAYITTVLENLNILVGELYVKQLGDDSDITINEV